MVAQITQHFEQDEDPEDDISEMFNLIAASDDELEVLEDVLDDALQQASRLCNYYYQLSQSWEDAMTHGYDSEHEAFRVYQAMQARYYAIHNLAAEVAIILRESDTTT